MDVLLLVAQVLLVVVVIVVPLFHGYDKFQKWSPQRKVVALALAVGIAVVAFSQYRRLIALDRHDLPDVLTGFKASRAPWYAKPVVTPAWEYLGTVMAGSVVLAFALQSAQKKAWLRTTGFVALFLAMTALQVMVKLRMWH